MLSSINYIITAISTYVVSILSISIPLGNGNSITFFEIYTFIFLCVVLLALFKRIFNKYYEKNKD